MSTSAPTGSSGGPAHEPARPAHSASPTPPTPDGAQTPPSSASAQAVRRGLGTLHAALSPSASPVPGPGGRGRRVAYVLAFALVTVLIPVTCVQLSAEYGLPDAIAVSLGFAQAGPLVLAVTRPLRAWWIVIVADTVCALLLLLTPPGELAWPWPPAAIVGYLALCVALGLRERRSTLVAVWSVTLVLSLTLGFVVQHRGDGTNVLLSVLSGLVLLICGAVRERGDAQRRLAEQETISEAERARRTLLEERARIARELHDVVAHHMSVITVQADSAPYRLDGLPDAAREEFGSIAETARESLSEMRRLLGVLRSEENGGERAPQPGLERLGQLVEATVRAGVPTELAVADGLSVPAGPRLPQAVQVSVYRIVQEALANVVRHAPGASARVSVTESGDRGVHGGDGDGDRADEAAGDGGGVETSAALTVLVVNGPAPGPAGPPLETTGTGHGLVGMRERVRLIGGTLDTGPLPDGGFRVAARIPLPPPAPSASSNSPASSTPAASSTPSAPPVTGKDPEPS